MTNLYGSLLEIAEVVWINALLSGDNALVIAMACRNLAGRQRLLAMGLGSGLAIVLRIVLTIFVVQLLNVPLLKVVGGVLLLWIAVKLITNDEAEDDAAGAGSATLLHAVRAVVIADAVMSIDNVLALSAIARGNMVLLVAGLLISIPFIIAGAAILMRVLKAAPILLWAGSALLGWVGVAMAVEDSFIAPHVSGIDSRILAAAGAAGVVAVAALMKRRSAPISGESS